MMKHTSIATVLSLPSHSIELLLKGRIITIIPKTFIRPGQQFAICATSATDLEEDVVINAWARCESCQAYDRSLSLEELAKQISWELEKLEQLLAERNHIFLAILRVYYLTEPVTRLLRFNGQFAALPEPLSVVESFPVLRDQVFERRKKFQDVLEPELEELQVLISQLSIHEPLARLLEQDIGNFLDIESNPSIQSTNIFDGDLAWIKTIDLLGNRSKELDEGKNNYQAGTDFEDVVRKSLQFLGFQVDESYKGGAGGLDLFCSAPYSLVGECKAGKTIPNSTVEELLKLGGAHLGANEVLTAAKLIIGPGKPTSHTLKAAEQWRISIINPMSLQKLVELKANYPGSVNLLELKEYLKSGTIDDKIDEYIQSVMSKIKIRSRLVQSVKDLIKSDEKNCGFVEIKCYYNFKLAENESLPKLDDQTVYEMLIELSSPLAGYLGRVRGTGLSSDRFYFLRDLIVD